MNYKLIYVIITLESDECPSFTNSPWCSWISWKTSKTEILTSSLHHPQRQRFSSFYCTLQSLECERQNVRPTPKSSSDLAPRSKSPPDCRTEVLSRTNCIQAAAGSRPYPWHSGPAGDPSAASRCVRSPGDTRPSDMCLPRTFCRNNSRRQTLRAEQERRSWSR
jgi:hypothetical protein